MLGNRNSKVGLLGMLLILTAGLGGCGQSSSTQEAETVVFSQIEEQETEPIILREEQPAKAATQQESQEETQTETQTQEDVIPYVDRIAQGEAVSYRIETVIEESAGITIQYPQFCDMQDEALQTKLNERILEALQEVRQRQQDALPYELTYETAQAGQGMVSFIWRGTYQNAYSQEQYQVVRTMNLDLHTGMNVRLKDYADIAALVSGLETQSGYQLVSQGVDADDFSAFLNQGYVTDYAITMLDYDYDFANLSLQPTGFSCIRDNKVVLFINAEHSMGDYVELIFDAQL